MGDVSHVVPSIHPYLAIVDENEALCHQHRFATAAGSPEAVRAAGNAMAKNPIPIVVPCHRVLRTVGGLGGYGGGLECKRWLLDLESGTLRL